MTKSDYARSLMKLWDEHDKFDTRLRNELLKLLSKGRQTTRFKAPYDIGEWEQRRIDWYERIFPKVTIENQSRWIIIKSGY